MSAELFTVVLPRCLLYSVVVHISTVLRAQDVQKQEDESNL